MENGKPYITTVRVRPARRDVCAEHDVEWPHHTHGLVEVTVCGETRAIVDVSGQLPKDVDVLYLEDGFIERQIKGLVAQAVRQMDASRKVPA